MEKIKCPSCYRKYKATARGRCPGCGQKTSWSIDPTDAFIADLNSPDEAEESGPNTDSRMSDLEYEIEHLQSGLRSLAWGVVFIVISMGAGLAMVTMGAEQNISCVISGNKNCDAGGLVTAGWAVLGLGVLIGLALTVGATTRGSSQD
jgi:hypothetical protein